MSDNAGPLVLEVVQARSMQLIEDDNGIESEVVRSHAAASVAACAIFVHQAAQHISQQFTIGRGRAIRYFVFVGCPLRDVKTLRLDQVLVHGGLAPCYVSTRPPKLNQSEMTHNLLVKLRFKPKPSRCPLR